MREVLESTQLVKHQACVVRSVLPRWSQRDIASFTTTTQFGLRH